MRNYNRHQQTKAIRQGLFLVSLLITIMFNDALWAQTRSLSGNLSLDIGPSEINRKIVITVRNHSIVIVPPLILRPITSFESTTVTLTNGSASVNYTIDNIITDPVDYSISIECVTCPNDLPIQYYSPEGNRFGLTNSVYIDPNDLPNALNLTAITRASIGGDITLDRIADRALNFEVTVFSTNNPDISYGGLSPITMAAGMSRVRYSVRGLDRAIGADRYGVRLQCTNCIGASRRVQVYDDALRPNENHSSIDFSVSDEPAPVLAPIINLLLE